MSHCGQECEIMNDNMTHESETVNETFLYVSNYHTKDC
jgi:hypothetical protein